MVVLAFHAHWSGSADDNRRVLRELSALADAEGFHLDQTKVWLGALRAALCCHDYAAAARWERMARPLARLVPFRYLMFLPNAVQFQLEQGSLQVADRDAKELLALTPALSPIRGYTYCVVGQVALARDEAAQALTLFEQALCAAQEWAHPARIYTSLLLTAVAQRRCGDLSNAIDSLRKALSHSRQSGVVRCLSIADRFVSEAFVFALQHGIEPDHVRHLISVLELAPPAADIAEWPWPNRVCVLGTPLLQRLHAPAEVAGRRQPRKPIELLHFIISRGGEPVPVTAAVDALWPEAAGDAAKKTFDITLHRLRRLLGADEAIRLEQGRLVLDQRRCWVDAFAFSRLAGHIESGETSADGEPLDTAMARAFVLYRGHFLGEGADVAWAAACRDRLRAQFVRLVEAAGARHTAAGRHEHAELCYRKAIELDPTTEIIYRRLMQSLAARGETAAAIEVFRRCREMLSGIARQPPVARNRRRLRARP